MSAQGNRDFFSCNPSPGEVEAEESGPFNTIHEFKASLDHIDTPWATCDTLKKKGKQTVSLFCI